MNRELLRFTDIEKPEYVPDGKIFRILFDANLNMMRIVSRDSNLLECMRESFSVKNEAAFYVSIHGYRAEEKVYLINPFGYFSPGMLFDVLSYIQRQYGSLKVVYVSEQCKNYISEYLTPLKRYVKHFDREKFEVFNICDDCGRNARVSEDKIRILRDYQEEAIRKAIFEGYGRGLIELPTSAGKSLVIANFIYNIDKQILRGLKYLIFVPNAQLVTQFYEDLLDYGFPPSTLTKLISSPKKKEDRFKPDASIIISNRQYLFKNKDKIPKVDVLINDEVHTTKPKSATIDLVDGLDSKIKLGFSATMPRNRFDMLSLVGSFGRLLFVEEITHLQERGYISKLEINLIEIFDKFVASDRSIPFNEDTFKKFSLKNPNGMKFNEAFDAEIEYINKNYEKLYAPIITQLANLDGNTLVLFDRLEFGRNMFEMAKTFTQGKTVLYIDGQTPVQEREDARSKLESSNENIIFGQCSILSTGINIKNLTNLVMMVSTKSFSRILQSIGRTLRLHKDKDCAKLYDISFNFKYSKKHLGERLEIYKNVYHKTPDTSTIIQV